MHDIDRAMFEKWEPEGEGETGALEQEDYLSVLSSVLGREAGPTRTAGGSAGAMAEYELASELLEVTGEAELEQFLGDLAARAVGAVRNFAASPTGQAVGSGLRSLAKQALPIVGQAIGDRYAPGIGGTIGSTLGTAAGDALGLELEGLSHEDREFEASRAFVRFADAAYRAAASAPRNTPPAAAARAALIVAARQHAPGLLATVDDRPRRGRRRTSGRWVRRGRSVVLHDI